MAVTTQELYDWVVANWGDKITKYTGNGAPDSNTLKPNTVAFYLDKVGNGVYFWNNISWIGIESSNNAAVIKNLSSMPGDNFGEKLQNAINQLSPGGIVDASDYVNTRDQIITTGITIDKPIRVVFPSMVITVTLSTGEDLFTITSDSVSISGSGRSPRSSELLPEDDLTVTRIIMETGRYHIYSKSVGATIIEDMDLYGVRTTDLRANCRDRGDVDASDIPSDSGNGDFYCPKELVGYPSEPVYDDNSSPNYVGIGSTYETTYNNFLDSNGDPLIVDCFDMESSAFISDGISWSKIDKHNLPMLTGCGGIALFKEDPGQINAGNNVNQVLIENVFCSGSYGHGLYIDTPILCKIRNCRFSKISGHGVLINGGTSTSFQTVYCSSSGIAGICLNGLAYSFLDTCVSEYSGTSLWLRSCFGVSVLSSGGEEQRSKESNYGLRLYDKNSYDIPFQIDDMSGDYITKFDGNGYMITGGEALTINSPLSTNIGGINSSTSEVNARHFYIAGNVRNCIITNPKLSMSGDTEAVATFQYDWEFDDKGGTPKVVVFYNPAESDTSNRVNVAHNSPADYFSLTKTTGEVNYALVDAGAEVEFRVPNDVYIPRGYRQKINGVEIGINDGDTTANRPSNAVKYDMFFDTTLGKPIWYNGTNWVDSNGTIV